MFRNGRRRSGRFVSVYWVGNEGTLGHLGLVVPKKFVRTSVLRNRVKRAAREVFRRLPSGLAGHDVVVRVRAPVRPEDWSSLRGEVVRLLEALR